MKTPKASLLFLLTLSLPLFIGASSGEVLKGGGGLGGCGRSGGDSGGETGSEGSSEGSSDLAAVSIEPDVTECPDSGCTFVAVPTVPAGSSDEVAWETSEVDETGNPVGLVVKNDSSTSGEENEIEADDAMGVVTGLGGAVRAKWRKIGNYSVQLIPVAGSVSAAASAGGISGGEGSSVSEDTTEPTYLKIKVCLVAYPDVCDQKTVLHSPAADNDALTEALNSLEAVINQKWDVINITQTSTPDEFLISNKCVLGRPRNAEEGTCKVLDDIDTLRPIPWTLMCNFTGTEFNPPSATYLFNPIKPACRQDLVAVLAAKNSKGCPDFDADPPQLLHADGSKTTALEPGTEGTTECEQPVRTPTEMLDDLLKIGVSWTNQLGLGVSEDIEEVKEGSGDQFADAFNGLSFRQTYQLVQGTLSIASSLLPMIEAVCKAGFLRDEDCVPYTCEKLFSCLFDKDLAGGGGKRALNAVYSKISNPKCHSSLVNSLGYRSCQQITSQKMCESAYMVYPDGGEKPPYSAEEKVFENSIVRYDSKMMYDSKTSPSPERVSEESDYHNCYWGKDDDGVLGCWSFGSEVGESNCEVSKDSMMMPAPITSPSPYSSTTPYDTKEKVPEEKTYPPSGKK